MLVKFPARKDRGYDPLPPSAGNEKDRACKHGIPTHTVTQKRFIVVSRAPTLLGQHNWSLVFSMTFFHYDRYVRKQKWCDHYSCSVTFESLLAPQLLQGLHHCRHDRCLLGLWSGTTLRWTFVPVPCLPDAMDNSRLMGRSRHGGWFPEARRQSDERGKLWAKTTTTTTTTTTWSMQSYELCKDVIIIAQTSSTVKNCESEW